MLATNPKLQRILRRPSLLRRHAHHLANPFDVNRNEWILRQDSQIAPRATGERSARPRAWGVFRSPSRAHSYQASTGTIARRCRNAGANIRDVATAVQHALTVPLQGHHRALLCAPDISGTAPSLELAARLAPSVPVTDPDRYRADPWRGLVDCSAAAATLGWQPECRWSQPR